MKRLVVIAALAASCAASPTAPTPTPTSEDGPVVGIPLLVYHNIPATTVAGTVVWVCATQYRSYVTPEGQVDRTIDHYIQDDPCPRRPID